MDTIGQNEIRTFYELSYKYQMLKKEMEIGDYGLPQPLPDRAYVEFQRVQTALSEMLSVLQKKMVAGFDSWIAAHGDKHFGMEDEEDPRISILDHWSNYSNIWRALRYINIDEADMVQMARDMVPAAQDMGIKDLIHDETVYQDLLDALRTDDHPVFEALAGPAKKEQRELYEEEHNYREIEKVLGKLENDWDHSLEPEALNHNFQLFHEALTTAHESGQMVDYIIEGWGALELLNALSAGEGVDEWDEDLRKLLGYPVRSRYRSYAAMARLRKVIAALHIFLREKIVEG